MSGGHLAIFKKIFRLNLVLGFMVFGCILCGSGFLLMTYTNLDETLVLSVLGCVILAGSFVFSFLLTNRLTKPTETLAQAIFHISPNEHLVAAPDVEKLGFGKDLVAALTRQIYDYAAASSHPVASQTKTELDLLNGMPVAVIGLDSERNIILANRTAEDLIGRNDWNGLPLKNFLTLKYNGQSIDEWAEEVKQKSINATSSWQKVEVGATSGQLRSYVDIAVNYRQKHPSGIEVLFVMFNHNEQFDDEEDALNMIAMSVHEIRTPLTILRGYIEVLRQELTGKVDPQTATYLDRVSASGENLGTFMANVLSVVKADQNELKLPLQEAAWPAHLNAIVEGLKTRAAVRGKTLQISIAEGLPNVALNAISINEVLTNLVENAIKYSPDGKNNIFIEAKIDTDGSVLTTVRDEGVGIPDSVVPKLFTRFYRNHRNRGQVAGSGLGLYISKEIISAHHGHIWVQSKEGEGTTIGFTLMPYDKFAAANETGDNAFTQVPHGWIKNHSMQRR